MEPFGTSSCWHLLDIRRRAIMSIISQLTLAFWIYCANHKNVFTLFIIFLTLKHCRLLKLTPKEDRISTLHANTLAADDLVMQEARASTALVWTQLAWNNPVSAPEGLPHWAWETMQLWFEIDDFNSLWHHNGYRNWSTLVQVKA